MDPRGEAVLCFLSLTHAERRDHPGSPGGPGGRGPLTGEPATSTEGPLSGRQGFTGAHLYEHVLDTPRTAPQLVPFPRAWVAMP